MTEQLDLLLVNPGAQLYKDAIKQGIKLPEEWHGYGQYAQETSPMPTKYLEMVREKFGSKVAEHIEEMLKHEIPRKFI